MSCSFFSASQPWRVEIRSRVNEREVVGSCVLLVLLNRSFALHLESERRRARECRERSSKARPSLTGVEVCLRLQTCRARRHSRSAQPRTTRRSSVSDSHGRPVLGDLSGHATSGGRNRNAPRKVWRKKLQGSLALSTHR